LDKKIYLISLKYLRILNNLIHRCLLRLNLLLDLLVRLVLEMLTKIRTKHLFLLEIKLQW